MGGECRRGAGYRMSGRVVGGDVEVFWSGV